MDLLVEGDRNTRWVGRVSSERAGVINLPTRAFTVGIHKRHLWVVVVVVVVRVEVRRRDGGRRY